MAKVRKPMHKSMKTMKVMTSRRVKVIKTMKNTCPAKHSRTSIKGMMGAGLASITGVPKRQCERVMSVLEKEYGGDEDKYADELVNMVTAVKNSRHAWKKARVGHLAPTATRLAEHLHDLTGLKRWDCLKVTRAIQDFLPPLLSRVH